VYEVYNNLTFQNYCKTSLICVIEFLPLVEESTAAGRNAQIQNLLSLQKTFDQKSADIQIVWIGAQTQPTLEKLFVVESWPALIVVSGTKNV